MKRFLLLALLTCACAAQTNQATKHPTSIEDFAIDWSKIATTNNIIASSWTIPAGLTKVAESNTTIKTVVRLSGGTPEKNYPIVNTVTLTDGQQLVSVLNIFVSLSTPIIPVAPVSYVTGPIGPQGPAGTPGTMHWLGAWSSGTTYSATTYDTVSYGGSSWIAVGTSLNVTPGTDNTKWNLVAQIGSQGIQGVQGIQGAQGVQGAQGIQGVTGASGGVNWLGAWSSGTTYHATTYDAVSFGGSSWIAVGTSLNVTPGTDNTKWNLMAQIGATGSQGPAGAGVLGSGAVTVDGDKVEDPDSRLLGWFTGLANSITTPAVSWLFADSIGAGAFAPTSSGPNGWYSLLNQQTAAMGKYQDLSAYATTNFINTSGTTTVGTWTKLANWGVQTGGAGYYASRGASGATITETLVGTSFTLVCLLDTDTNNGLSVVVDGGAPATVCNSAVGSKAWSSASISLVSSGSHTVVITAPATLSAYYFGSFPVTSGLTNGVLWYNFSLSGFSAVHYCNNPNATQTIGWLARLPYTPNLIIEAWGTNDFNGGSSATFQTNLTACATFWQATYPLASLLFVNQQNQSPDTGGTGEPMANYYAATRAVAASFNGAYANVGDRWGTYANASAFGLMFNSLHPNLIGHSDEAQMMLRRLFPTLSSYNTGFTFPVLQANHIGGVTGAGSPTFTLGAGVNSTATVNGCSVVGSPASGPGSKWACAASQASDSFGTFVIINTGVGGTGASIVVTMGFSVAYTGYVVCMIAPQNASTATITNMYWSQPFGAFFNGSATPLAVVGYGFQYFCGQVRP